VRVRELVVAGVREAHIPRPTLVELTHAREIGANRVPVLDPDHGDLATGLRDAPNIGRRLRELDLLRRNLLGQPVDRVELRDRLPIGVGIAGWRQRPLRHLNHEEGDVETAVAHLRQVRLRHKTTGVVALRCEVRRLEIDVRVDRQYAPVNRARLCYERVI